MEKITLAVNVWPDVNWEDIEQKVMAEVKEQFLLQTTRHEITRERDLEKVIFGRLRSLTRERFKPLARQLTIRRRSTSSGGRIDILALDTFLKCITIMELKMTGCGTSGIAQLAYYVRYFSDCRFTHPDPRCSELEAWVKNSGWPHYGLLVTRNSTPNFHDVADDCPFPLGCISYHNLTGDMDVNPALDQLWDSQLEVSIQRGKQ